LDVQLILSAEMWFKNDYSNDYLSSLWSEHADMNNIISMVTASRNGNIQDDISSKERNSFNKNITLSAVTRLRYGHRSDDTSSLWSEHAGMKNIISMATTFKDDNMYDKISTMEPTSFKKQQ
jgi:hypothetical protein